MSYRAAALWSLAAFGALHLLVGVSAWLRPSSLGDLVHLGGCEALVFLFLCALILRVHTPDVPLRHALAFRPTSAGLLMVCFAVGLCLRIPTDSLRGVLESVAPTPETVLLAQAQLLQHDTLAQVVVLVLVLAIVGPLVEELFYRGALFGPLVKSRGLGGALTLTALAFVVTHGQWRDYPSLLLVALILGYVRGASGSLLPALALHSAFNLSAIWVLVKGMASATEPLVVSPVVTGLAWLAVVALLFLAHRIAVTNPLVVEARRDDLR